MPSPNVMDLMELYARRGVADWLGKDTPSELRTRAGQCLGPTQIANKEQEAIDTIRTVFTGTNANQLSFIPMPKAGKGIDRCFFLPVREITRAGKERLAFELFLLVQKKKCLAFRFEAAHSPTGPHGYGHVQMSRKMLKKTIPVEGSPPWLPDSYPAFPVSTSDPLKMFLAMTTAIHGYESPKGVMSLLIDIFQKASRTSESSAYLTELREMLIRESIVVGSSKRTAKQSLLKRLLHWLS